MSGPYKNINKLKKDFISLTNFGFEDLDIKFMNKILIIIITLSFFLSPVLSNPKMNVKQQS